MTYVFMLVAPNLQMWESLYYIGHWAPLSAIVLAAILPKAKLVEPENEGGTSPAVSPSK